MNSQLASTISLLLTAVISAESQNAELKAFCRGMKPLPRQPGIWNAGKRWFLQYGTQVEDLTNLESGCGRYGYISEGRVQALSSLNNNVGGSNTDNTLPPRCECTIQDISITKTGPIAVEESYNIIDKRPNVHVFLPTLIDPKFHARKYNYDFRAFKSFGIAYIATDDFETYHIAQTCNMPASAPEVYRVWTRNSTIPPRTLETIKKALWEVAGVYLEDLVSVNQKNCTYPATTYTVDKWHRYFD